MFETLQEWLQAHPGLLGWLITGSVAMFVGGLVAVPWLIVRLPEDFFLRHDKPPVYRHPVLHLLILTARNLVGWPLLILGFAMLFLPGQGLLTILVAIALVDFPGKRRVELALVRRPTIHRAIDWLRRKAGSPRLILPEELPSDPGS